MEQSNMTRFTRGCRLDYRCLTDDFLVYTNYVDRGDIQQARRPTLPPLRDAISAVISPTQSHVIISIHFVALLWQNCPPSLDKSSTRWEIKW